MFVIGWFAEQSLCHGSYTHKITTLTASLGTAFDVFFSQISQLFFSGYLLRGEKTPLFFSPQSITAVLMISLSARIIAAFPRGGSVMELMIVVITKTNQIKLAQVKILLGCANRFSNFSSMCSQDRFELN